MVPGVTPLILPPPALQAVLWQGFSAGRAGTAATPAVPLLCACSTSRTPGALRTYRRVSPVLNNCFIKYPTIQTRHEHHEKLFQALCGQSQSRSHSLVNSCRHGRMLYAAGLACVKRFLRLWRCPCRRSRAAPPPSHFTANGARSPATRGTPLLGKAAPSRSVAGPEAGGGRNAATAT